MDSTRRRGASMLELLTSIAILGLVMTIIVQCTLSGGRAFRETRRRDQARELCNRALDRAAVANSHDVEVLDSIAGQVSAADFRISLITDDQQHLTATATWENDLGVQHSLELHAWLTVEESTEPELAPASQGGPPR